VAVTLASGARVETFDTLDSTSLEAKRRVSDGEVGPLWLLAKNQTAGYGRRGSSWSQSQGDVAATYLFSPDADPQSLAQLSFVAALGSVDALRHFAPRADFRVKWPNDVLVDGGKIAGLLLELVKAPSETSVICFGAGVNIVSVPDDTPYPTARLIDLCAGAPPTPHEFVTVLDQAFGYWEGRWRDAGFAAIREEWLANAVGKGRRIRVRLPDREIEGIFIDLDFDGALVVDCDGERRRITAGAIIGF
jgi:BirA family biotin operon repressor/biotin-[acetyl-CoA-carboxylase] ligase